MRAPDRGNFEALYDRALGRRRQGSPFPKGQGLEGYNLGSRFMEKFSERNGRASRTVASSAE